MTKATAKQIREHYKAKGFDVRISRDGVVTVLPNPDHYPGGIYRGWLAGHHVDEYRITDGQVRLS